MDYEILSMLLIGWLLSAFFIQYLIEDFKNWRDQSLYMKLVIFHLGLFFTLCSFLIIIFILNGLGVMGSNS